MAGQQPRTAVVTGAGSARGIGREIARQLGAAGFAVVALDVDGAAAEETAAVVAAQHDVAALGLVADVTDEDSVDRALSAVEAADLPPVAALVNNAAISEPTPFLEITRPEWERTFEVNVTGAYLVTRRVLPGMLERGHGRIVNISSVAGERGGGLFGGTHYAASKAAVLGLTRALAREVGRRGVVVNAVAPGLVDTDIVGDLLSTERGQRIVDETPVGRGGRPADVAATAVFLAGEGAGYITGATVDVNGGSHMA